MKAGIRGIFTLMLFASVVFGGEYKQAISFDPQRDAAKDISEAIKEAGISNKRILIDVGGNWCPWCRKLGAIFDGDTLVKAAINDNFVLVKLNYSKENKNERVLSRYPKISGYPHIFLLEKDGKFLLSQTTDIFESGKGYDRDKIIQFLKKEGPKK